eukprot:9424937-Lingulodinium_polyedra.AAC.1
MASVNRILSPRAASRTAADSARTLAAAWPHLQARRARADARNPRSGRVLRWARSPSSSRLRAARRPMRAMVPSVIQGRFAATAVSGAMARRAARA